MKKTLQRASLSTSGPPSSRSRKLGKFFVGSHHLNVPYHLSETGAVVAMNAAIRASTSPPIGLEVPGLPRWFTGIFLGGASFVLVVALSLLLFRSSTHLADRKHISGRQEQRRVYDSIAQRPQEKGVEGNLCSQPVGGAKESPGHRRRVSELRVDTGTGHNGLGIALLGRQDDGSVTP